jgi:MGT family glycosyltransferase
VKFLWLSCAGGGALPPQLAMCEALMDAGHEVIAVVRTNRREQSEQIGMRVETFHAPSPPAGLSDEEIDRWVGGNAFLGATYADALRDSIRRNQPDRLLVDGMSYSALVEAQASGIPHAALWHCLVDIAETPSVLGFLDAGANLASHNAHRRERGLREVESVQDNLLEADWFLAFAYEAVDSPRQRTWPNLAYVGAAVPRTTRSNFEIPPGNAPLVIVSFSTADVDQTAVLQRVVDGLATLDIRVVATVDPVTLEDLALPANVEAVNFVPHDEILPAAALMVSHVGHGTMSAAARHGVPILAIPLCADQNRNAEILTDLGIGSWLPPSAASSEIARMAERLLNDDATRRRSNEVALAIAGQDGLDHAVELVTNGTAV